MPVAYKWLFLCGFRSSTTLPVYVPASRLLRSPTSSTELPHYPCTACSQQSTHHQQCPLLPGQTPPSSAAAAPAACSIFTLLGSSKFCPSSTAICCPGTIPATAAAADKFPVYPAAASSIHPTRILLWTIVLCFTCTAAAAGAPKPCGRPSQRPRSSTLSYCLIPLCSRKQPVWHPEFVPPEPTARTGGHAHPDKGPSASARDPPASFCCSRTA